MKCSIMEEFIKSKGLFDEFMVFKYNKQMAMTRKWLENNKDKRAEYRKNYYKENKERIYTYIPNGSKLVKKERNEDIVRMRMEGMTLREIGDKKGITHQAVNLIIKKQNL